MGMTLMMLVFSGCDHLACIKPIVQSILVRSTSHSPLAGDRDTSTDGPYAHTFDRTKAFNAERLPLDGKLSCQLYSTSSLFAARKPSAFTRVYAPGDCRLTSSKCQA
jgi:hypothetical protein